MVLAASSTTVLVVAVPMLVLLAAVLVVGAARRMDGERVIGRLSQETVDVDRARSGAVGPAGPSGHDVEVRAALERTGAPTSASVAMEAPVPYRPPDPDQLGVTRRQFLNRSVVSAMAFSLSAFALASLGFLWPSGSGGFESKIRVGTLADIQAKIADGNGFAYFSEGRMWITEYPASALDKARQVYAPSVVAAMERGITVIYQKCPHLGCRVPQCLASQWFECPCHGSQYNRVGEKKGGPAPRGMDRFPVSFSGDTVVVDTGTVIQGPPIGTNTTGQEAEGPHCVSGAAGAE